MKFLRLLLVFCSFSVFAQQGGMWIPSLLEGEREAEMKKLGMKISAKDIYNHNQSSLKDAIVHFGGGCTSEIISPNGLLLTNHHCGYGQIQSHSTVENDYLEDGFWAMSLEEELPNSGLTATFIVKIEDVTTTILNGVTASMTEEEQKKKIEANIASLSNSYPKEESYQNVSIRSFFEGNQFVLFVTEVYKDVRLVGAPPSSIGKFGSDTDNWVWPRHTGDFALFRIYADKNNKPADYSVDNVPYKPKHFLPISLSGIEEDDFTMVFGFPGRTSEYLPSFAVEQTINNLNPARIEIRDNALKVMDEYMRADRAIKIQYASKFARIANYWKKWIGEKQGLEKSGALQIKRDFEKEFTVRMNKMGKQKQYGNLLADFEKDYNDIEDLAVSYEVFVETFLRNVELLTTAYRLNQLEQVLNSRGEQAFTDRKNNTIASLEGFYKDFNAEVDQKVFEKVIAVYVAKTPAQYLPEAFKNLDYKSIANEIYSQSKLTSYSGAQQLLSGTTEEVIQKLNDDKAYSFVKIAYNNFFDNIIPKYDEINTRISATQRNYMKAILELFPDARIFPDANSTLRITYGKVGGYAPRDAVYYEPVTYLEGVVEKYIPGDYEFDVPQKLLDLYHKKDYGIYGKDGKMAVNFIARNHTTGGNSGSPALDAHGNLIGLNFDRVWEGTMSDIHYDPEICRNIMVDIRYVLFVVDKYAGAKHLIDEMKIVYPKKKK
ncbi:MAG: S46 family peptidase [Flavobacteriaceae bacterium]